MKLSTPCQLMDKSTGRVIQSLLFATLSFFVLASDQLESRCGDDRVTKGANLIQRSIQSSMIAETDEGELPEQHTTCISPSFNKCTNGNDNVDAASCKMSIEYPMTKEQRKSFKLSKSDDLGRILTSPYVVGDAQLLGSSCEKLQQDSVFQRPEGLSDKTFWNEFLDVLNLQFDRRNKTKRLDEYWEVPALFRSFSLEDAAQAVKKDFPTHWPTELVKQFLGEGASMNQTIVKQLTHDDFVNKHVLLASIVGWAVRTVSPVAFQCKWYYGRPRPEELAWRVYNGEDVCGANQDVKNAVNNFAQVFGYENSKKFTAYLDVGCPRHPSWPAMHSAASSASMYLPVIMELTREQELEARRLDYAVAASRSLAGVHYHSDNLAGLAIGQHIVAERLQAFLEDFDLVKSPRRKDRIKSMIAAKRFDWYQWVELGCHKDSSKAECNF